MAVPFKRVLKSGMKGNDVFAVKRALKAKGFGKGLILTGPARFSFGAGTVTQLKNFQRKYESEQMVSTGRQLMPSLSTAMPSTLTASGSWVASSSRPHRSASVRSL